MANLPKKLVEDSIVEALCEIRFECDESVTLPELVIGQLAGDEAWSTFQKNRLPINNIPAEVRAQDPNLRREPLMELREPHGARVVKIGTNVFSYHNLLPYPGWSELRPAIENAVRPLFEKFTNFKVTRIGFRYVNIFTSAGHGVNSVCDLNYKASVNGSELNEPINLNYRVQKTEAHTVQVRLASPGYVNSPPGQQMSALVDIDVFTNDNWRNDSFEDTMNWVDDAHEFEKEEFFNLFTPEMFERLVEQ